MIRDVARHLDVPKSLVEIAYKIHHKKERDRLTDDIHAMFGSRHEIVVEAVEEEPPKKILTAGGKS